MPDEEKYILIERFFNHELSDTERVTFEQLLATDMEFREEVKLQRSIIGGIQAHGKDELKKELAAIYLSAKPDLEKQKYKPKAQRNFRNRILKWLIGAGIITGVAFLAITFKDKIHERVSMPPSETEKMQHGVGLSLDESEDEDTHHDTVWHTVHTHVGTKRDTINVYSAQEAADTLKRMSNSYTVIRKEVKVISMDSVVNGSSK